jgi:hypothetical protein
MVDAWIQLWYCVRAFVNVTLSLQYNSEKINKQFVFLHSCSWLNRSSTVSCLEELLATTDSEQTMRGNSCTGKFGFNPFSLLRLWIYLPKNLMDEVLTPKSSCIMQEEWDSTVYISCHSTTLSYICHWENLSVFKKAVWASEGCYLIAYIYFSHHSSLTLWLEWFLLWSLTLVCTWSFDVSDLLYFCDWRCSSSFLL